MLKRLFLFGCCGVVLVCLASPAYGQINCEENPRSCGEECRLPNGQPGVCGIGNRCKVCIVKECEPQACDLPCERGNGKEDVCGDEGCRSCLPTVSEWGMIMMTLLLLTAGTIAIRVVPANVLATTGGSRHR